MLVSDPMKLNKHKIEYPCGIRLEDKEIVVSYGVQDCTAEESRYSIDDVLGILGIL